MFTKKPPGFKIDFRSTDKFYRFTNIYDLKFFNNETTLWNDSLNFFEICREEPFAYKILSNEGNIKASILLILLKCIVVGYCKENESFICRLFSNYEPLNMLFHIFRYINYSVFHETFAQKFIKKLSFSRSNFENSFRDVVYYRKLGFVTLWY